MAKSNIPRHVGFIPDGNRRWAVDHGLPKEAGYAHGINPGLLLYEKCKECGINEVSIYCFTQDNTSGLPIRNGHSARPALHSLSRLHAAGRRCLLSAMRHRRNSPVCYGNSGIVKVLE